MTGGLSHADAPDYLQLDPADTEHLAQLLTLGVKAFEPLGDYRQTLDYWIRREGVQTWFVRSGTTVTGFITYAFIQADNGPPVAEIIAVAVAPQARRKGLGRALLLHGMNEVRQGGALIGVQEITLNVASDNEAARRLFKSEGFGFGTASGRYPLGQDCMRLVHNLDDSQQP